MLTDSSYILFKNPILWNPTTSGNLQACAETLYTVAEANSKFKKHSDALEILIDALMEHIDEGVSSKDIEIKSEDRDNPNQHVTKSAVPQAMLDKIAHALRNVNFAFQPVLAPEHHASWDEASQAGGRSEEAVDGIFIGCLFGGELLAQQSVGDLLSMMDSAR